MQYISTYSSPMGEILLACGQEGLTGLWFQGGRYFAAGLDPEHIEQDTPVFEETRRWLDLYFSGGRPDFMPPLCLLGTPFRRLIWELLLEIPYGETTTYGELARRAAARQGRPRLPAQAVGGAVGHNPVSILVPCHRVVGASGSLTGYGGGVDRKARLLALEGVDQSGLFIPTRGTAL